MSGSPPPSPEQLLSELGRSVRLTAVCLSAAVRQARPQLLEVAHGLALTVTHAPGGHEEVICLVASGPDEATQREIDVALSRFSRPPFLLVLAAPADPASAARFSTGRLQAHPDLLARDLPRDHGAVMRGSVGRRRTGPGDGRRNRRAGPGRNRAA
jgi:hypothetical protein